MSETVNSSNSSVISQNDSECEPLVIGWDHVNFLVQPHTLHLARAFYYGVLGLEPTPVPESKKAHLMWFNIGNSGQQLHVTSEHDFSQAQLKAQSESPRHPCFKVPSQEKLDILQRRLWELYEDGEEGAPMQCDRPGADNGGQGKEGDFPNRFFARDYAGNRLEFTL
ncbi:hypothetical protein LTR64_000167 [Lithohypha guttulata]|uniref:VOC domain-containing protein n=1 Tax=Lithohypha guttulata TaxID=1690604 RepID=A0AAN7STS3_9EURO|nr:hypothetical protein LTR51_007529 [Lithohypha guttulata]KAK5081295.1 hypothetical protein LTR05_008089 [Lithohypha guttulata]